MRKAGVRLAKAKVLGIAFAAIFTFAACASGTTPTSLPTEVLIPSTATDTPTPVTPTATLRSLLGPSDIHATATPSSQNQTAPVEQAIVNQAIADLATFLEIGGDQIQLVALEQATWTTPDLNCGDRIIAAQDLAVDGYRLLLRADDMMYEYHTDNVTGKVLRCVRFMGFSGMGSVLLIEVDPVAAQLVAMAQRQMAGRLDLPVRRVRLVDVIAVTWPDSSLGCPLPDQTYTTVDIPGYRIVLSVGEDEYIYHTDTERVIACEPRRERLPLWEQTPESEN